MTAYNVVRFRVKPGRDEEFLEMHRRFDRSFPGLKGGGIFKAGDRTYCLVGEWADMNSIAAARPSMLANLDRLRDMLEDLGGGLGVTDPVSGEVLVELRG